MNKIIYIAGPYTGTTPAATQANISRARAAAVRLWKQGFAVLCPHLNSAGMENDGIDYHVFTEGYIRMLKLCNVIYLLKDWELSPGARAEAEAAALLGLDFMREGVDDAG